MPSTQTTADYCDRENLHESLELDEVAGSYTIDMDVAVNLYNTYEGETVEVQEGTVPDAVMKQINEFFGTNFDE